MQPPLQVLRAGGSSPGPALPRPWAPGPGDAGVGPLPCLEAHTLPPALLKPCEPSVGATCTPRRTENLLPGEEVRVGNPSSEEEPRHGRARGNGRGSDGQGRGKRLVLVARTGHETRRPRSVPRAQPHRVLTVGIELPARILPSWAARRPRGQNGHLQP